MKLCMSSVLDRQLKERSRCRSAGQPERGGNRSILPKCKETPGQFRNKSERKARLKWQKHYRLSAKLRYLRRGSDGHSLIQVSLQLLRNSSHKLPMRTPDGGASAICV